MFRVTDLVAWLPATSTAALLITCPAPSVVTVTGAGQRATPLVASAHVKVTVAFPLFHPAPFAAGVTATSTTGGVLSMLSVTDAVGWLPATSTAVPLTTCPAPSAVTVTGSGQLAILLVASPHVKLTRTSVLFQPAAFAGGLTTALTAGGVLSMLSVTEALDWFPAMSTAVPLTTCLAPSAVTVTGSGQRAILLVASVHVKLTRTSVLFQPAAFAGGLTDAVMTGGSWSSLRIRSVIPQPGPARSATVSEFVLERETDRSI